MGWLRSRRAATAVGVGVLLAAAVVVAAIYVEGVLERRDFPSADDEELETIPAEGVTFTATVVFDDERIEYDYQVTNERDAPVVVVDPTALSGGAPAEGGRDRPWRDWALRPTDPAPLDYWTPRASRGTSNDGFLLDPGESRSGQSVDRMIVDDPPERIELCVEVVEVVEVSDLETGGTGDGQVELPNRASGEPVAVACTGSLAVD